MLSLHTHILIKTKIIYRPDEDVLKAFYSLMEFGKTDANQKYILVATAVAHTFCRNNPGCGNYIEITNIVEFLENELNEELEKDINERSVREKV